MTFAASVKNVSTNARVIIDDIPTPVTLDPGQQSALVGAALIDIQNSLLLRHHEILGQIQVTINGQNVQISKLDLLVGSGEGGPGSVDSFNGRTGNVVPISADYAAFFVDDEIPAGVIDGVNDTFTVTSTPAGSFHLFKNGLRQTPGAGNDFVRVGDTITYEAGNIPQVGDSHICDYRV